MMSGENVLERLKASAGEELGVSDWLEITQERINAFAECTEDRQWIHVDPEKARHGPFGKPIAHGFLLLSLLVHLSSHIRVFQEGVKMVTNIGLNRVRFLHPVPAGSKVRNRVVLKDASPKGHNRILITLENTLEIQGEEKPALKAEVLALLTV